MNWAGADAVKIRLHGEMVRELQGIVATTISC